MVDDWNRIAVHGIDGVEHVRRYLLLREVRKIEILSLQQLYEECRRACLKPKAAEFIGAEGTQKTEGIVDARAIFHEMIAVVAFFQSCASLLVADVVAVGELLDALFEIAVHLFLGDSAERVVALVHGDVGQIVQV